MGKIPIKDNIFLYTHNEKVIDKSNPDRIFIPLFSAFFTIGFVRSGTYVRVYEVINGNLEYVCTKITKSNLSLDMNDPSYWLQYLKMEKISSKGFFDYKKFEYFNREFFKKNSDIIMKTLLSFNKKPIKTDNDYKLFLAVIKAKNLNILN